MIDRVINDGEFIRLLNVSAYYAKMQQFRGVGVKGAINHNPKRRLIQSFGETLVFVQTKPGIQNSGLIPKGDDEKIVNVMNIIREKIKELKCPFSTWPPPANEIMNENVEVPTELKLLLEIIFAVNTTKPSSRIERLIRSITQDNIYSATRGTTKTVKHVQLGLIPKRKTG